MYVGLGKIGRFDLWITTPVFHHTWYDLNLEYYDCMLSEHVGGLAVYVNLHKDSRFDFINFKYPPKPPSVKKKKNRFGEEEEEIVPDSVEEAIYRMEYNYFVDRKEQQMPLWRLHVSTINKIIEVCQNII